MLFSSDKANASRRPLLLVVNQSFSGICSRYSKVREEGGLKANATSIVHFFTLYVVYKNSTDKFAAIQNQQSESLIPNVKVFHKVRRFYY